MLDGDSLSVRKKVGCRVTLVQSPSDDSDASRLTTGQRESDKMQLEIPQVNCKQWLGGLSSVFVPCVISGWPQQHRQLLT